MSIYNITPRFANNEQSKIKMIIEIKTQWRFTKELAINDLHEILQTIGKCKIATIKQVALTDHYEYHAIVEGDYKEIFKIK